MPKFILSSKSKSTYPDTTNEIVFIGKSNVGKSSLINSLYKKGLAYVGKTPGKTKLLNFYDIDSKYTVCDVPGYGFANRSFKEIEEFGRFMEEYFSNRKEIRLVVIILDIRRDISQDDLDMINYLNSKNIDFQLVFNKMDKLSNNELFNQKQRISKQLGCNREDILTVSAVKRINLDILKDIINSKLVY